MSIKIKKSKKEEEKLYRRENLAKGQNLHVLFSNRSVRRQERHSEYLDDFDRNEANRYGSTSQ